MAEFTLKQTAEEVQMAVDNGLSFGDSPTGGDTLEWDGNAEGLLSVMDSFYKVSSATPTMTDFANGCTVTMNGESCALSFEEIQGSVPIDGVFAIGAVFVVNPEGVGADLDGLAFPEAGIYFMYVPGYMMATSITIPGYTGFPVTKKIEEKYLPGAVILYADAESYLYATEDTSDTSKRMTRAELLEMVKSGRMMWCGQQPDYAASEFRSDIMVLDMVAFAIVTNTIESIEWFTAEYVPE